MDLFLGTQERVRNSRGKQAISVRATEVLLYINDINMIIIQKDPEESQSTYFNLYSLY